MEDKSMSTEEPMRQVPHGDDKAMDALLDDHLPGLRAFVRLRCGPTLGAKESSSDVVPSICREVIEYAERMHRSEAAARGVLDSNHA